MMWIIIIINVDGAAAMPMVIDTAAGCGPPSLDEVGDIHGYRHLLNLSVVERLDVLQRATIVNCHEVDCDILATKSPATADPVNMTYSQIAVGSFVICCCWLPDMKSTYSL